jgi:2-phosphoglycolate phosphatase
VGNDKFSVDAVMLDLDGTLIDSAPIYYEIIDIIFAQIGVPPVPRETLQEAMDDGDFDWDFVLPVDMKKRKQELIEKARRIIDEIAPSMFRDQLKLIPGADKALKAMATDGLKLAIVTSTPELYMAVKLAPLRKAGVEALIEIIITADDVRNKKPDAEPLVKCSQKLGASLGKCVYVGDTRVDIRAGKAAGMRTVGVLTGFDDYGALKREKPDAILNSIAQMDKAIDVQN